MSAKEQLQKALEYEGDDCLLWPLSVNARGYPQMRWEGTCREVHRIVCRRAHGEPPEHHDAAHSCGVPRCINPRHLRWLTRKANIAEGMNHTNDQSGEANKQARLTAADILAIRAASGRQADIAKQFGISQDHVSAIKRYEAWSHIAPTTDDRPSDLPAHKRQWDPGRHAGIKHPSAKLTEADVFAIRAASGSHQSIADRFGIARSLVTNIKNRKAWRHLP